MQYSTFLNNGKITISLSPTFEDVKDGYDYDEITIPLKDANALISLLKLAKQGKLGITSNV